MKALVIGGTGFIGSHIVRTLVERDYEVSVFSKEHGLIDPPENAKVVLGDYLDTDTVKNALEGQDVVYQLAGMLGTAELTQAGTIKMAIESNVIGLTCVLDACREVGVKDVFFPTKPNEWSNAYSLCKAAGERVCDMYTRYHGLRVRLLRWLDIFGPGQKLFHVRKAIPTFFLQALHDLPMEVYGDGEQYMELLFVKDAAASTVDYMELPWNGLMFAPHDCGCGVKMKVIDIAKTIRAACSSKSEIVHVPMRMGQGGDWGSCENSWKFTRKINWTPFEEALEATRSFYANLPQQYVEKALHIRYGDPDIERGAWLVTKDAASRLVRHAAV